MLLKDSPARWRELHPDLHPIYGHESIEKTMEMIGREYIKWINSKFRVLNAN